MASTTTSPSVDSTSEVAILGRLLVGSDEAPTRELATHFLRLEFGEREDERAVDGVGHALAVMERFKGGPADWVVGGGPPIPITMVS